MGKFLLMSVIFATVALPLLAAREPHPVRALKKVLLYTLAFNAFYVFAAVYLYPRLG